MVAFAKGTAFDEKSKSSPSKEQDIKDKSDEDQTQCNEQALAITAQLGVLSVSSKAALISTASSTRDLLLDKGTQGDGTKKNLEFVHEVEHEVGQQEARRRQHEGAQCVVCLDHMDTGAVLTMACNHTFHLACLVKWEDSPCPVCRYHHNLASVTSQCQHHGLVSGAACRNRNGLLVCVICGFVGCGGRLGHGQAHYEDTLHAYALEMDSQQVWDFAGDGYVHRLIMSKGQQMKLIEAPDPNSTSSADDSDNYERGGLAHLSERAEEEATHRKLEGLAYQYNELLAAQLDAQRNHFETELNELRETEGGVTGGLMSALTNEQRQMRQRLEALKRRTKRVTDELKVVEACNDQIRDNVISWDKQRSIAEQEAGEVKKATEKLIPTLEARVSELMMQLDLENSGQRSRQKEEKGPVVSAAEEVQGADDDEWTVEVLPAGGGGGRKKKGRKKGK